MSLTPEEIETLINGDKSKKTLSFYTLESWWINKLARAGIKPDSISADGAHYYNEVDRNRITVRKENINRKPMSQERKDANAKNLADGREAKKNNVQPN